MLILLGLLLGTSSGRSEIATAAEAGTLPAEEKPALKKRRKEPDGLAAAIASFSVDGPELPKPIRKHAFRSGGFPYEEKLDRELYDERLPKLQIELLKVQSWARESGERVVIVFEGRDAAGKGGAIARFQQHMNPRSAHVVALTKPSDAERGQWYFQRYVTRMPTAGEIVMFDRSWYNRAVVEPVNGFCTAEESETFLREAPQFEAMLTRDRVHLIKLFLDVGREMQLVRLWRRRRDPLKHWKLSPIDFKAVDQWDAYSTHIERMFARTHTAHAPWSVILANDKLRTRLAAIECVLARLPYAGKDETLVGSPDPLIVGQDGRFFDQDDA
jgi:polyphosphate kinase 2